MSAPRCALETFVAVPSVLCQQIANVACHGTHRRDGAGVVHPGRPEHAEPTHDRLAWSVTRADHGCRPQVVDLVLVADADPGGARFHLTDELEKDDLLLQRFEDR